MGASGIADFEQMGKFLRNTPVLTKAAKELAGTMQQQKAVEEKEAVAVAHIPVSANLPLAQQQIPGATPSSLGEKIPNGDILKVLRALEKSPQLLEKQEGQGGAGGVKPAPTDFDAMGKLFQRTPVVTEAARDLGSFTTSIKKTEDAVADFASRLPVAQFLPIAEQQAGKIGAKEAVEQMLGEGDENGGAAHFEDVQTDLDSDSLLGSNARTRPEPLVGPEDGKVPPFGQRPAGSAGAMSAKEAVEQVLGIGQEKSTL